MKILLLTFYFQPDLSAGSFRATALVRAMKAVDPSIKMEVITTFPNRYNSYNVEALERDSVSGASVFRIRLPRHQGGLWDQSLAFLSFARQVIKRVRGSNYDIVVVTSGRLMSAVLGAFVAAQKSAVLYLDIRDIFTDTIKDTLPRPLALVASPFFSILERFAIKRASRVNLVSRGFEEYFRSRYPFQLFSYFTNGIDDDFLLPDLVSVHESRACDLLNIVYAGNIGEGQGLHVILPLLAKKFEGRAIFKVIGDGGRKELLRKNILSAGVTNVLLMDPMSRDLLVAEYKSADILFLHLNDYDAFRKVLPSKIFEYAAMGKPIWAGISGYSADFVRAEITNAAVFPPCDVEAAEKSFSKLAINDAPRADFIRKYSRENICRNLAKDIFSVFE